MSMSVLASMRIARGEFEFIERERQFELRKLELELATEGTPIPFSSPTPAVPPAPPVFDISQNIRMVLPFFRARGGEILNQQDEDF